MKAHPKQHPPNLEKAIYSNYPEGSFQLMSGSRTRPHEARVRRPAEGVVHGEDVEALDLWAGAGGRHAYIHTYSDTDKYVYTHMQTVTYIAYIHTYANMHKARAGTKYVCCHKGRIIEALDHKGGLCAPSSLKPRRGFIAAPTRFRTSQANDVKGSSCRREGLVDSGSGNNLYAQFHERLRPPAYPVVGMLCHAKNSCSTMKTYTVHIFKPLQKHGLPQTRKQARITAPPGMIFILPRGVQYSIISRLRAV